MGEKKRRSLQLTFQLSALNIIAEYPLIQVSQKLQVSQFQTLFYFSSFCFAHLLNYNGISTDCCYG